MGSLILCHKKRAKRPFEISRVHMRIYTIEELCYYICNNLYLIDYTIVNELLCRWNLIYMRQLRSTKCKVFWSSCSHREM